MSSPTSTTAAKAWTVLVREGDGRHVCYCDAACAAAEPDQALRAIVPQRANFDLLILDSRRTHCHVCVRRLA